MPTITHRIRNLLQELEKEIPPPPNAHHMITYAQYGSDSKGYEDKLALQINLNGSFYCFFLDDEDFELPLQCVAYVEKTLLDPASRVADAQKGVGPGRYASTGQLQRCPRCRCLDLQIRTLVDDKTSRIGYKCQDCKLEFTEADQLINMDRRKSGEQSA